jgi:SAM-dependent methyltransferase
MQPSTGSFEFFDDYEKRAYALQPDLYDEIQSIITSELESFTHRAGRLPKVLDVGSAGLIPYDPRLTDSTTILDLFPKPPGIALKSGVNWQVGDILRPEPADEGLYDVVIMSSVLHHLADSHNNVVTNVRRAFRNVSRRLRAGGVLLVFESCCPPLLASAQDVLYPAYSRILVRLLRFTYVRMLSRREVVDALRAAELPVEELPFRRPPYIAQMRWRVPSKYYPLTVHCIKSVKP